MIVVRSSTAHTAHSWRCLRSLLPILTLFLLIPWPPAQARVWHIRPDGSGDAPTIQAGVDVALTGDSVVVHAGLYEDTTQIWIGGKLFAVGVHIKKNLSLIGKGATINIVDASLPVIAVYAEGLDSTAVISGFTITTQSGGYGCIDLVPRSDYQSRTGLKCVGSGLRILGSDIVANDIGVDLVGSAVTLEGSEIHGCGDGVRIRDSSDAILRAIKVCQCGSPISCTNSSPRITANDFHDCCGGLYFAEGDSPAPRIVRCNVLRYQAGGIAAYGPNVVIENNTLDSGGYGWFGIYATKTNTTIRNNIVVGFGDGIVCSDLVSGLCECNDVYGATGSPASECCAYGIGNFAADPEFCGIDGSGNYDLQSDSPCAPGNHPGGAAAAEKTPADGVPTSKSVLRRSRQGGIPCPPRVCSFGSR